MALLELDRIVPGIPCDPLHIERATTWLRTFRITDKADGTPAIDPSWTYSSRLFDEYGAATAIPIAVTPLGSGRISLALTAAQTAALTARSYEFDLRAIDGSNRTGAIMRGRILVGGKA